MSSEALHVRIERRIRAIEIARNVGFAMIPSQLDRLLDGSLLERIAAEAAKEAQDYYHEQEVEPKAQ